MEDLIVLLVLGSSVTLIVGAWLFHRFKSEELADKRQLDRQVWAAENGLDFIGSSNKFERFLLAHSLRYDPVFGTVSNAVSFNDGASAIYFFDFYQSKRVENASGSVSQIELNYEAVCVQFQHRDYLNFHLSKRDGYWVSGYIQIRSYIYPDWIPESVQIASNGNDAKDIMHLLESNKVLDKLVNHKNFSAILFRGPIVLLYLNNQLPVSERSLEKLKRWAKDISEIADPHMIASDPEIAVNLLKKENRNEDGQ